MVLGIVGLVVAAAALVAWGLATLRQRERALVQRASRLDAARAAEQLGSRLLATETGLESLPEGIVVLDPEGRATYVNGAARGLVGRRVSSLSELAPAELRDECRRAIESAEPAELEFVTAGRTVHATLVPGPAGRSDMVLVLRDITAAKRSERIRSDFVANASHELKTPVSAIAALAEALHDAAGHDSAATGRFVQLLQDESRRLARLATDLLDLSRLEVEVPPSERVDVARVVGDEVERLRPRAETAGLRVVLEPVGDVKVSGSESDLGLLVNNLLDNAIHYTPEGGEVRVTLRKDDDTAALVVSDTGMGIASRDLDRIFERFYRADPARSRQTGGTGLGLSIVKHVVEAHGGEVRVQSVLGAGSTFTVRLPLADRAQA